MRFNNNDQDFSFRFFCGMARQIVRLRWLVVAALIVITGFAASRLPHLRLDTSNEIWFVEGDRTLDLLNKFKRMFSNEDFVYVLLGTDDFFQAAPVERFRRLASDLATEVPYVLDITWLGNAEFIEGRGDSIDIYELFENTPESREALDSIRAKALDEPLYVNNLISPDGRVAGMLVEMEAYPDDRMDPRKEIAPAVRKVLAKPEHEGLELYAVGTPLFDYDLDVLTVTETIKFMGLCILVQAGLLFWLGRGVWGIVVPLAVVVTTVVWTFAAIVLYGITLNIFVAMLPVLLICVGIGDSMHVISEFHDGRDRGLQTTESLVSAMGVVGLPCLLTSVTTAAGFLSFFSARIKPFREMGTYAATGVIIALAITYCLVPIAFSLARTDSSNDTPLEGSPEPRRRDLFDRLLAVIGRIVTHRPRTVVVVFLLLTITALVGLSRVEIESATVKMLSPDVPIRRAYDYADAKMGNSMSVEIMLDTGHENGINDPGFLENMDALDRFIKQHPLATTTNSVLDIHRQMRRAFHENRPEYYSIPETREEASQYLLLYEMSGGGNKDKLTTYGYDVARLTARTRSLDTKDTDRFLRDIEEFAGRTFGPETSVEFAGMITLLDALTALIGQGQIRSFAAAAIVITIIMIIVLRSVPLGLISMVPNVFPVLATLGLMGFAGIYLGIGLMTISAIIIGVAVDDTIHFFMRYKREFARHQDDARAIEATLASVGRPITFTTLTLTLGFAVLALSDVTQIVKFGTLAGFAFTWALLADLLFAPALVMLVRPLRPRR